MPFNPPPTGRGYEVYEVISALQKAIRRSDVEAAAYWAAEMKKSDNLTWCWNRLREILSEDIGPTDRYLPATIEALRSASMEEAKRKPGGGGLQLTHAVILMATAEKTRVVSQMAIVNESDFAERREIPDEALDRHTRRGKAMGRTFEHFITEGAKIIQPPAQRDKAIVDLWGKYTQLRARIAKKDPSLPKNPFVKPGSKPKAKPGTVSTKTEGGPETHQLPGMEKP